MCREVRGFVEIDDCEAALGGTRYPILRVPHHAAPWVVVRGRTTCLRQEPPSAAELVDVGMSARRGSGFPAVYMP